MNQGRLCQFLLFTALAALFSACAAPKEPAGLVEPEYFNLDKLLDKQIEILATQTATIQKESIQENQAETKTIASVNWQRELEMFRQGAINRPAWRHDFATDTTRKPGGSALIRYRRKPESSATVQLLEIELSSRNQPERITALVTNDNMLFSTGKTLEMRFGPGSTPLLRFYQIKGTEKMIFTQAKSYQLGARVLL